MNASKRNVMNALVAHPDVLRWFIWAWNPPSGMERYSAVTELFKTMISVPIDITITNSTISIFKGLDMDVSRSPTIVKALFGELTMKKNEYFEEVKNNPIFRNIRCSKCKLNFHLEQSIDRVGWVTWAIYWIIKSQPAKIFITKDILHLALRPLEHTDIKISNDKLPIAPWMRERTNSIQGIYERLNKSIYNECFAS